MPWQVKVYRILIASPNDVKEERESIPGLIQQWNKINSKKYGVLLQDVMWEIDAYPEIKTEGDPQKIIDRQIVKDCDMLIGIFWTRLGTPTARAESGTVEEINWFLKLRKPVMLYFSTQNISPEKIDTEQLKRLRKYKKEIRKKGIVSEYTTVEELHNKLFKDLSLLIQSLLSSTPEYKQDVLVKYDEEELRRLGVLKTELVPFLRKFEADWISERDSDPESETEGREIIEKASDKWEEMEVYLTDSIHTELLTKYKKTKRMLKKILRSESHEEKLDFSKIGTTFYRDLSTGELKSTRTVEEYIYEGDEFWEMGNDILELLREILNLINVTLEKSTKQIPKKTIPNN